MTKNTAWVIFLLLALLFLGVAGGAGWFAYDHFAQSQAAAAHTAIPQTTAVAPAAPSPAQDITQVTKTARKPVSWAGERYYGGRPEPTKSFAGHIQVLDNLGYSAGYCPERKGPAWVAYRVTAHAHSPAPKRPDKFMPDLRISDSPKSSDFSSSGYDRGHLAPNHIIALCYGREAQEQTFLLTNIVPQRPKLNRDVWEHLEKQEGETYGNRYGTIWVIDGPVYGDHCETLTGGEAIPVSCYKIIVHEEKGRPQILAFIMPQNVQGSETPSQFLTSVSEIQKETKLDFLRDLPDDIEERVEATTATGMW